jgi:bifunctional non-homologous end joining protein LigD
MPPRDHSSGLPKWVKLQLCKLAREPPQGPGWLHEIKYDGYRMHVRLDRGRAHLLTRTGLDWTPKYPSMAAALSVLPAKQAYLDGELCGVRPDWRTSFSLIQTASDSGNSAALVFFLFDLLYLDGDFINSAPLYERKERLRDLVSNAGTPLQYSDHQIGRGPEFYAKACELSLEGIISKRADAPYSPGDRGLWVKVKCENREIGRGPEFYAKACELSLEGIISKRADAPYSPGDRGLWVKVKCENREEFVVVGWTDPEGSRPGSVLCCSRIMTGKAGSFTLGASALELTTRSSAGLWRPLQPLATSEMPLDQAPSRTNRFGSPVVLSRVHWVRPELVAEVKYLTWTDDNLLRQVVYEGLREDKPATEVRRPVPTVGRM